MRQTAARLALPIAALAATLALAVPGCLPSAPLIRQAASMNSRGAAQLAAGDLEGAEASFRVALEYNDRYTEPHNNLGLVAMRRGHYREARRHFRAALDRNRDFAAAWTNLGVALSTREDATDTEATPANAMRAFREALAVDPGVMEARVNLTRLLLATGHHVDALEQARRLNQLFERDVIALTLQAEAALAMRSMQEAADSIAAARAIAPRDIDVRMVGARIDMVLGATGAARRALRELVAEPSVRADARALLAAIALAEGDVASARREIAAGGREMDGNATARAVIARIR
jgi:tetratricopeptide (TPR) repeat protein